MPPPRIHPLPAEVHTIEAMLPNVSFSPRRPGSSFPEREAVGAGWHNGRSILDRFPVPAVVNGLPAGLSLWSPAPLLVHVLHVTRHVRAMWSPAVNVGPPAATPTR